MRWIGQTLAVLALNIRTIPQRLSSSGVAIIGIAGVVVVFVSVLSIAAGFTAAMQGSGSPDRALVMRSGADSEMTSGLSGSDVDVIKQAPGISRDGKAPLAAAELMVIIDLPKKSSPDAPANVPVRGIGPESIPLRSEFSIVEGRMFKFGTNEVIAGLGAKGQFVNLNGGDTVVSGQNRWDVAASSSRTAASPRPRSGSTRARCRAPIGAATRINRCSHGSRRATPTTRSATGSRRTRSSTCRSAARTSTTPHSRRR